MWIDFVFVLNIAFLALPGLVFGQKNDIKLENGTYSNVLIAIDSDVEENEMIIENLKAMFTSASQRLYLATKQHVHWKEIKILVPATWSRKPHYGVARTESYETANIVVHDCEDDKPYVENPFGCGKEGLDIHMTPSYILVGDNLVDRIGPSDKVLVQQWAYYRWGLFEEYYEEPHYDQGALPGYSRPGHGGGPATYEGTRCTLEIHGEVLDRDTGEPCRQNPHSMSYSRNCVFVPGEGQTAKASLLYDTGVNSIYGFCEEDSTDPGTQHNAQSPSLHNKLCSSWSAWRVMREKTSDFVFGPHEVFNTSPVFEVIQAPAVRSVVLVLDTSGSMGSYDRFVKMIQSSTEYILNIIPDGSQLGIVCFSSYATIYANLTLIDDDATRNELVDALPASPGGGTSIGSGVLQGIEVLGDFAAGGYLLVLSDGYGNTFPYISDTYPKVEDSGVIIDTIAISEQADPEMKNLSEMTTGIPAFCSDADSGSCIVSAFQATITSRQQVGTTTAVPFQILNADLTVPVDPGFVVVPVIIDTALGNDTVFTVTWTVNTLVFVEVSGPGGISVDPNDPRYNINDASKIISVKIANAMAGRWYLMVNTSGPNTEMASVSVTSKPLSEDAQPITLSVILGSRDVDHSNVPYLAIYGHVQQGYQPVVDAGVEAIVANSLGGTSSVGLLDNGSGADLLTGDGLYSGYFLNFTSNGRYSVKVDVVGSGEVAVLNVNGREKRAGLEVQTDPAPSFMRTASGGAFEVTSYTPDAGDRIAPARIHDLRYVTYSYNNSTVNLRWTAVGDDLDQGTAFRYEMRYAKDFTEITESFNSTILITNNITVNGDLSVVAPSGVVEELVIVLPERGDEVVYYFSVRAWDEAGNVGDLSNVASLAILFVEEEDPVTSTNKALIIGVSCAVAAVVLAVVGVLYCWITSKNNRKAIKPIEDVDFEQAKEKENGTLSHSNSAFE